MKLVINPGTEPIKETNEKNAFENMKHFLVDCSVTREENLLFVRVKECDGNYAKEGRFAFLVYRDGYTRCHLVHMPGLPLDKVRYMDKKQNIWDFPRLYVDHSSWVWSFALLKEEDFEEPEEK